VRWDRERAAAYGRRAKGEDMGPEEEEEEEEKKERRGSSVQASAKKPVTHTERAPTSARTAAP
jgi:hypothetical protein